MILSEDQWTIGHLRRHLQYAVDLEFWTIPFYMSALYSIKDRTSKAYDLILSIVNQEMLHLQASANISNAFGLSPKISAPVYSGTTIPHIDFALDQPDPRPEFQPFTAEIGACDVARANAMCLIEYPAYFSSPQPESQAELRDTVTEYGSIAAFYDAIERGVTLLAAEIKGGRRQIDFFSAFYRQMPTLTVQANGVKALSEVRLLIDLIRDQGEARRTTDLIDDAFQNTADDTHASLSHFEKFEMLRNDLPETYPLKEPADLTERDAEQKAILLANFRALRRALEASFAGDKPPDLETLMFTVGAGIASCWQHGVLPEFD